MKRLLKHTRLLTSACLLILFGCQSAESQQKSAKSAEAVKKATSSVKPNTNYTEYKWVRQWDRQGFESPVEAFSLLLPDGWSNQGEILWNPPGTDCAGTNSWFKAQSNNKMYSFDMMPNAIWTWTSNPQMQQFYQNNRSSCSSFRQPMDAEPYLRQVFAAEIGNPQILQVSANPQVVSLIKQRNEEGRQELMSYGAAQVDFFQTAITATVKWEDGNEGIVMCGVSIVKSIIPNVYNGSYDTQFTTSFFNRTIFRYPAGQGAAAKNQLSTILGSMRTNPRWKNALDQFWKDVRRKKQVAHVGRIALMDRQTAEMGKEAIRKGQENLNQMDAGMRSWEAKQSTQDKMQTDFIKTIREVENYRDESGKVELSSGYNHAWSRSDGSSFILSDDPNFNPSSVFQDQRWKEMKKVD